MDRLAILKRRENSLRTILGDLIIRIHNAKTDEELEELYEEMESLEEKIDELCADSAKVIYEIREKQHASAI